MICIICSLITDIEQWCLENERFLNLILPNN